MNYKIRYIQSADLIAFNRLVGVVAREKKYLSFIDAPPLEMSKAFIEENIKENWPHLVAECNGNLIGWCDITSEPQEALAHTGFLGIGVHPDWRGQGVGKNLLLKSLDYAQLRGFTRIELTVRQANLRAISLYEEFGFKREGLHINAIRIDGVYENQLSMALLF